MRPFNLDEYLANPSKEVITRDGRPARIICTDKKSLYYPVVALIPQKIDDTEQLCSYTNDGRYFLIKETPSDLFFASEKHEGWAPIYGKFLTGEIFSTKEEAEEYVKRCGTKGFVAIAKVEWEE